MERLQSLLTLTRKSMKFPRVIFYLILPGLLVLSPLTLKAQSNAPGPLNRVRQQQAPGVTQGALGPGIALGGPVGIMTEQQRASYETAFNSERAQINNLQTKLR